MTQFILKIPENKKGKSLIDFLRQIDFIEIDEANVLVLFQKGISQSFSDLKQGKTKAWKHKTIRLKNV
jgi:hypothetical protein